MTGRLQHADDNNFTAGFEETVPVRISKSHRERDPNGHITSFALRVGDTVTTYPADGPEWRHVAAWVVQTLYEAGVPIPTVRAGLPGKPKRLLLGHRDDFKPHERRPVEGTDLYMKTGNVNAHAYLLIIFGVLPAHYGDEDCWVEYEPVFRRPTHRRDDDQDESALFQS